MNMDLVRQRSAELKIISEDRKVVALAYNRVKRIDQVLATSWGIDFHDGKTLEDLLPRVEGAGPLADYWNICDRVAQALEDNSTELAHRISAELHDALANPAVLGPVTSTRRAPDRALVALRARGRR